MKQLIQKLRKAFAIFFVRRMYVITQLTEQGKMYYKGQDSLWTTNPKEAQHYKSKPNFGWISDIFHKVELYYA